MNKADKMVFSFRTYKSKIRAWQLYAKALCAKDIGILWSKAIDEYICNHPLSENEQIVYEALERAEILRNQEPNNEKNSDMLDFFKQEIPEIYEQVKANYEKQKGVNVK